jgi:hypothetical protein
MSRKKSAWTGVAAALALACVVAGCLFGFNRAMNKVPGPAAQMPPVQHVDVRSVKGPSGSSGSIGSAGPGGSSPGGSTSPPLRPGTPGDTGAGGPAGPNGPGVPLHG